MADQDFSALEWVRAELEETLNQARTALESYADSPGDSTRLRFCLTYLHQVHGSLQMVELAGAVRLAAEMENTAQALMTPELAKSIDADVAQNALMQAILQLPPYMDAVQRSRQERPEVLQPLVNELLKARGEAPETDSSPEDELPAKLLQQPAGDAIDRFEAAGGVRLLRAARQRYQKALLALVRGQQLDLAYRLIERVLGRVSAAVSSGPAHNLLRLSAALADEWHKTPQRPDPGTLITLRQIDRYLRDAIRSGAGFVKAPVDTELAGVLVEQLRQVTEPGPVAARLQEEFGIGTGGSTMGPDRDTLQAVSATLREEVSALRDDLDLYVRGSGDDSEPLEAMLPRLGQMAGTLNLIGLRTAEKVAQEQIAAIEKAAANREGREATLLDVAGALVYLDATLGGLAGDTAEEATTEMELVSRDARDAVIRESRTVLEQVKSAVVEFVAAQWDAEKLRDVPERLRGTEGSMAIIGLSVVAQIVASCRKYVENELLADGQVPEWQILDTLADAISSVDYFLERLSAGHRDERTLDVAEESVAALGYPLSDSRYDAASAYADRVITDDESHDAGSEVGSLTDRDAPAPEATGSEEADTDTNTASEPPVAHAAGLAGSSALAPAYEPDIEPEPYSAQIVELRPGLRQPEVAPEPSTEPVLEPAAETASAETGGRPDDPESWSIEGDDIVQAGTQAEAAGDGAIEDIEEAAEAPAVATAEEGFDLDAFEFDDDETDTAVPRLEAAPAPQPQPVPEPPAEPEAPPAPGRTDASAEDDVIDDEIIEIFLEEADEVLETLDRHIPVWMGDLEAQEDLTEVRRAFHTLKGSGRMVGATVLGELAWAVENLLNHVMDGRVAAHRSIAEFVMRVREAVPAFRDAFAEAGKADPDPAPFVAEAEAFLRGELPEAAAESAPGAAEGTPAGKAQGAPEDTAQSAPEDTAQSELEETAQSELEETAQSELEETAQSELEETAQSELEETAQSELEETAQSELEETAQSELGETAQSELDDTAQNELEDTARSAVEDANGNMSADAAASASGAAADLAGAAVDAEFDLDSDADFDLDSDDDIDLAAEFAAEAAEAGGTPGTDDRSGVDAALHELVDAFAASEDDGRTVQPADGSTDAGSLAPADPASEGVEPEALPLLDEALLDEPLLDDAELDAPELAGAGQQEGGREATGAEAAVPDHETVPVLHEVVVPGHTAPLEGFDLDQLGDLDLDDAPATPAPVAAPAEHEGEGALVGARAPVDASLVQIFEQEAGQLLGALRVFADEVANSNEPLPISDAALHAAHTLKGSAAMASLEIVQSIAGALEASFERVRLANRGIDRNRGSLLRRTNEMLARAIGQVRGEVDLPNKERTALIAELLAMAGAVTENSRPGLGRLFRASGVEDLIDAGDVLSAWELGDVDTAALKRLTASLAEVATIAAEVDLDDVARLAGALATTHERAAAAPDRTGEEFFTIMREAHEALVNALDEIAASQTANVAARHVQMVEGLLTQFPEAATGTQDDLEPPVLDDVVAAPGHPAEPLPVVPAPASQASAAPGEDAVAPVTAHGDFLLDDSFEPDDARAPEPAAVAAAPAPAAPAEALSEEDAEVLEIFLEEAEELLEAMDESVNSWPAVPEEQTHLEVLLRSLHTLKGGARLAGLSSLGDQVHDFESWLIGHQEDPETWNESFFAALLQRYDALHAAVQTLGGNGPETAGAVPTLDASREEASAQDAEAGHEAQTVSEAPAVPEADAPQQPGIATSAASPAAPASTAEQPAAMEKPADPPPAADSGASGRNASQEMIRVGAQLLDNLVSLAGETSILRARVQQEIVDTSGALDEMETTLERVRDQLRRLEIETEAQVLYRRERDDGPDYEDFDPLEMDRYSQLQQLARGLSESASDMLDLKETLVEQGRTADTLLTQQARINTELQEGLMRTRMVPFSRLVPRLRRIVRQIGQEVKKRIEFDASNAESELDRNMLERMVPPLEHMLRNAIDHGIEAPEVRREQGKPEAGHIRLSLRRESSDVVIEIEDDGRGIDAAQVLRRARDRGLVAGDADLSEQEVLQFIFEPGFSTAENVTQISGRGVGMDVVQTEVKQLGGTIAIRSRPGQGTTFSIRLPFTVSVSRALMVQVGNDTYAVPLSSIEGIVRIAPRELERRQTRADAPFEYAGQDYRFDYLGRLIGREPVPLATDVISVPVLFVRSGDSAMALYVDRAMGSREIVVKGLGAQFAGVGGLSGATILGDGSVVVILDLANLVRARTPEDALVLGREDDRAEAVPEPAAALAETTVDKTAEMPAATPAAMPAPAETSPVRSAAAPAPRRDRPVRVLVVDDSVTVRKVTSRLLQRKGMTVSVAKDGVDAVAELSEQRPDVMLLDIEMPRMDGFEVATHVRSDAELADLPIVMISSRTGEKHRERAGKLGVDRFLGKPFQESELLAVIDELTGA